MNHRTYDGQRFSPLARINKGNVKSLKLAYAVALGGGAGNEFIDRDAIGRGRLPLRHRLLGRALQDRRHVRRCRPHRLAHGPEAGAPAAQSRRRIVGQSRDHRRRRSRRASSPPTRTPARWLGRPPSPIRRTWRSHRRRSPSRTRSSSAPPMATGRARLGWRARCRDRTRLWREFTDPGARRARQRNLEGQHQRVANRRRRCLGDRHL